MIGAIFGVTLGVTIGFGVAVGFDVIIDFISGITLGVGTTFGVVTTGFGGTICLGKGLAPLLGIILDAIVSVTSLQ